VIGASKAGTTSLHQYLGLHPEIAMTEPKEPHLMVGPGWREKARAYAELFSADAPVRGESSTGYSVHTVNPDAPGNIAELIPDARILYLVRDPLERTIAHYAQHVIYGREREPIERAVRAADPDCYYVAASRYATQVEAYLGFFAADRILVIDQDDLRAKRRETLGHIFAHVGADAGFWDAQFADEHNTRATDNLKLPPAARRLQLGRLNRASKRLLPEPFRAGIASRLRRGLGREVDPDVSPELRAQLAESLGPEVERLRKLTGQRFAGWSV
jgi:sulfotransferase family protein